MRPSYILISLVMTLTALTIIVSLWVQDILYFLIIGWGSLIAVVLLDVLLSRRFSSLIVDIDVPTQGFIGMSAKIIVTVNSVKTRIPNFIQLRFDMDSELSLHQKELVLAHLTNTSSQITTTVEILMLQRGQYEIYTAWLKWQSRFKFLEIIASFPVKRKISVIPDISTVLSGAIHTQMLTLDGGQKDVRFKGDGSEFHQLREFVPGMDPRSIDWKRSARVHNLVVRETRAERNHQVILCVDSGRLMAERLEGIPKLDRAINAALAMCWASGLAGDQVGFYNFDNRPRIFIPPRSGRSAFPHIQAVCSQLRYETLETNHTLGLTHLSSQLKRRSLIIIFSDFVDSITAELMMENIQVLSKHHFIIFVALRDPVITKIMESENINLEDISRSVAARQVLNERHAVLLKLSRLGVVCLDSTPEKITADLISRYIEIKLGELI